MQNSDSRFLRSKGALIAAAAACLAFSFATPAQSASANEANDIPLGYCPWPGAEVVADGAEAERTKTPETVPHRSQAVTAEAVPTVEAPQESSLRVATYNANLTRDASGELLADISVPGAEDATEVARVIQTVRPDVLVLTGIDVDGGDQIAQAFNMNYLAIGTKNHPGLDYPHRYTSLSNSGVESGADLNSNGMIGDPGDALGYGDFPGQLSMIVYSKHPIDVDNIRDFSALPWNSMPNNNIPAHFTDLERNFMPLASVNHWDIPIQVHGDALHVLASSAADVTQTPHALGRNEDQIRFWHDYIDPETDYILDHRGHRGPLDEHANFVIAGSLKADPAGHGPADPTAINQLLDSEAVIDPQPERTLPQNVLGSGIFTNNTDAQHHTAIDPTDPNETYRADYVLASAGLSVADAGVLESGTKSTDFFRGPFANVDVNNENHIVWADITLGN